MISENLKISVSGITRTSESKAIYVLIEDGERSAEFSLPGCKQVSNKGFNPTEIKELKEHIDGNQDEIFKLAKSINPITAMMK